MYGVSTLNELQTDTSLALEVKSLRKWEFNGIDQALSCISLWFSSTPTEAQTLWSSLIFLYYKVSSPSSLGISVASKDLLFNVSQAELFSEDAFFDVRECPIETNDKFCMDNQVGEPMIGKRKENLWEDSSFEPMEYKHTFLLFGFNDKNLPFQLNQIITSDLKLLTLLEAGLPSWVIFLQSYPFFKSISSLDAPFIENPLCGTFISSLFNIIWGLLLIPSQGCLHLAKHVSSILLNIYEVLARAFMVFTNRKGLLLRFVQVKPSSSDMSFWHSVWNELFSKVFRSLKNIICVLVTFLTSCNRHRLSIHNYFKAALQQRYDLFRLAHLQCSCRSVPQLESHHKSVWMGSFFLRLVPFGTPIFKWKINHFNGSGFASKLNFGSGFFHLRMKLPGKDSAGVVTAFYLTSNGNNHDELDFEFLGNKEGKPNTLQTNVFSNGIGNREQRIYLWFDPAVDFHNYQVLWNEHQIVFFVDETPIRVFKNKTNVGVSYPSKPMQIEASLWDGDGWATDGGKTKTNWSYAPFKANFQGFDISGCSIPHNSNNILPCYSPKYRWNLEKYWKLNSIQQRAYENVRNKYLTYDYCFDKPRFAIPPSECPQ
ncbi:hypothetical protein GH714_026081 [Hevea brasiliensis]|uniref:xyloglucan:xyloglucosyl transferase n=1 Tax=Hevea brasiliensis TaxID=3981 RepID=A0A6A6KUG3_HEVBR|nr:hypothetical protein GH714_026081 [Hevea brasiliensis]